MESWQKQHINRNLSDLLEFTKCNVQLISRLRAADMLSQFEEEKLNCAQLLPQEKSRALYDILLTRSDAYRVLIECLQSVSQTGAVNILRQSDTPLGNFGLISYDENHILGRGRQGTIVCKGTFDKRLVAVKILHSAVISAEDVLKEVEFLRQLDHHENIVRLFMAEKQGDQFLIALEYCIVTLEEQIRKNVIDIEMETILQKSTVGLAYLHKLNITHRDVKPTNILLTETKQVKLSDFGFSKRIDGRRLSGVPVSRLFGTVGWTAPEVTPRRGNETMKMTLKCDIFSLGCVFWYGLTNGIHPFGEELERAYYIIHGKRKDLPNIIDSKWSGVILSMISKSPEDRPAADEVLSTLWSDTGKGVDLNNNILIEEDRHDTTHINIIAQNDKQGVSCATTYQESSINVEALPEYQITNVKQTVQKFEKLAAGKPGTRLYKQHKTLKSSHSYTRSRAPKIKQRTISLPTSTYQERHGLLQCHEEESSHPPLQRSHSTPAGFPYIIPLNAWEAARLEYEPIKCVLVGDFTPHIEEIVNCFYNACKPKRFFKEPICQEKRTFLPLKIDGNKVFMDLGFIYAGVKRYEEGGPRSEYPKADVYILCFSLVYPASLELVVNKYYPDLLQCYPDTPFLLVGTQLHLRTDRETVKQLRRLNESPITYKMGVTVAKKIQAERYVECSTATKEGLDNVLFEAARAFWRNQAASTIQKKNHKKYKKKA